MNLPPLQVVRDVTNDIAIDAYLRLRYLDDDSQQIQQLEEILSTSIYVAEENIQKMRSSKLMDFEDEYYRRRTILKRIADGLAWYILNFDSHAIHGCSIGSSAGFMAGKEGYFTERKLIRDIYTLPEMRGVIQCDITNILHWGDVIAVDRNGKVISVELKGNSSLNDRRATRQKRRYKDVASFLKDGQQKSVMVNRTSLRTVNINITFKNYWDDLYEMISIALETGFSWRLFDDCVYVGVINTNVSHNQNIFLETLRNTNWDEPKLKISSLGRHFEKNLNRIPPTCLPLTIFSIDTTHGINFLLGNIDAVVVINIKEIVLRLNNMGVNAKINDENDVEVETEKTKYIIDDGAWSKLLNELLTVPSFLELLIKSHNSFGNEFLDF